MIPQTLTLMALGRGPKNPQSNTHLPAILLWMTAPLGRTVATARLPTVLRTSQRVSTLSYLYFPYYRSIVLTYVASCILYAHVRSGVVNGQIPGHLHGANTTYSRKHPDSRQIILYTGDFQATLELAFYRALGRDSIWAAEWYRQISFADPPSDPRQARIVDSRRR